MRSPEQHPALPGRAAVQGWAARIREFAAAAPLPVKILLIIAACVFALPLVTIGLFAALIYAPYALWTSQRSPIATASVALWGIALVAARTHGLTGPRYLLLVLPPAIAVLSHVGALGRWPVPCRTAAWALLWSLPVGIILASVRIWRSQPLVGPATAWLIALVVVGWRLAKAMQDSREYSRRSGLGGALAAPYAVAQAGAPPWAGQRPADQAARAGQPARAARPAPEAQLVREAQAVRGAPPLRAVRPDPEAQPVRDTRAIRQAAAQQAVVQQAVAQQVAGQPPGRGHRACPVPAQSALPRPLRPEPVRAPSAVSAAPQPPRRRTGRASASMTRWPSSPPWSA